MAKLGLTPYKTKGGEPFTGGRSRFLIENAYGTSLAEGDPVKVSNGYIQIAANTSAGVTGVFAGCKYIDVNTGQPVESGVWVAGTSSGGEIEGETHALGFVVLQDAQTYLMESQASVAATLVGATYAVSVGTPNTILKRSTARMAAASTDAGVYMVKLRSIPNFPGNIGSANPVVEVELVAPALIQA
jgi:hypothetical protein